MLKSSAFPLEPGAGFDRAADVDMGPLKSSALSPEAGAGLEGVVFPSETGPPAPLGSTPTVSDLSPGSRATGPDNAAGSAFPGEPGPGAVPGTLAPGALAVAPVAVTSGVPDPTLGTMPSLGAITDVTAPAAVPVVALGALAAVPAAAGCPPPAAGAGESADGECPPVTGMAGGVAAAPDELSGTVPPGAMPNIKVFPDTAPCPVVGSPRAFASAPCWSKAAPAAVPGVPPP